MNEPNWQNCSEGELWKYVATHLKKNGISTVLVGGAVVSIYSEGAYRSGDLDFVLESLFAHKLPALMKQIGFEVQKGRHYKHPLCQHLFVEFAAPPPGIGDDLNIVPHEIESDGVTIKIYSPTDCIRDRLSSYIYYKATECLDQAVLVAKTHPFNLQKVEAWCQAEGASNAYDDFVDRLKTPVR
jgi:hypothetical protein